ncbi:DUF5590 domain-containing protein [Paenibacillus ginsengarvi]|uniref:Cell wall elongation regulator TseB-like domain-containing protein n=1 Tax=Paenibacillus ginsengarvi TaxID=400777 RepID=A0A3B0BGC3_9BACL|nr:DUF5590 domain-containing protein [Paenibacillus ginsengarvi]RKN72433.1 hypothetical protein D7M11_28560 [Paenibacillus ginsengarvi]
MGKKIMYSLIAVLLLIVVALVFFYRTIHSAEWADRAAAIETVTASTYMRTIDKVENFVGEDSYRIVFGKDGEGKPAIAWVHEGEVHMEYETAGVTESWVREQVMKQQENNDILRVMPGVLNEAYVWEVLYKRKEDGMDRYYYTYYRFDNGLEVDTWKMLPL